MHILTLFRHINTIIFRKIDKNDYMNLKSYRLIVFMSILNKKFEKIIIIKIVHVVEIYDLLFIKYCDDKKFIFFENALHMMIKVVHVIWKFEKNLVITFFIMNFSKTYDYVVHRKLIYNLRKRRIHIKFCN